MNPKTDNQIMKLLKLSELSHILGRSNKGEVTAKILFGDITYRIYLDAVPMEDKLSEEILKTLHG